MRVSDVVLESPVLYAEAFVLVSWLGAGPVLMDKRVARGSELLALWKREDVLVRCSVVGCLLVQEVNVDYVMSGLVSWSTFVNKALVVEVHLLPSLEKCVGATGQ